jgi:membrane protein
LSWEAVKKRGRKLADLVLDFVSLRWVRAIWMYLVRIVERMSDDHIFLSAAGIAFNTIICLVPLTLILFYLLGIYLDSEAALQTIHAYIDEINLFPFQREQLIDFLDGIIGDFVSGSSIAGVVGAVGLIYTASTLFAALRTVFNRIFHIKDTKNLVVSWLKDFALLSIVGIMLVLINTVLLAMSFVMGFSSSILGSVSESLWLETVIPNAFAFLITFFGFYILYYMVPDKRLPAKAILLSTLVGATMWTLARFGFEYYVHHFWRIGKIYGSYALIVAATIWIYYSSLTLLFAAEVGEMYIERKKLKGLFLDEALTEVQKTIHSTSVVNTSEDAGHND